jgi:small basic protein (TIGR04137 family)
MSLDASLKAASTLSRHRNVLTKSERLSRLVGNGKMELSDAHILGLPKTANRKITVGKKTPKKPEAEDGKKGKKK